MFFVDQKILNFGLVGATIKLDVKVVEQSAQPQIHRKKQSAHGIKDMKTESKKLFKSDGKTYSYKTTIPLHPECEKRFAEKCNWARMSRLAVIIHWPFIVCEACQKHFDIKEVNEPL